MLLPAELQSALAPAAQLQPRVALVLGSGHGGFIEQLDPLYSVNYADLPGFVNTGVAGHSGRLVLAEIEGVRLAVFAGRFHYYEGLDDRQVALPVLAAHALGARELILTCACGAVNESWSAGDIMLIIDQINLQGRNPLVSLQPLDPGRERFVDLSRAFARELSPELFEAAERAGVKLRQGVLAALLGPNYETPAEVRMLRAMDVDAVCMSTIPEVICARWLGLRVLGLALVANRAADEQEAGLSHQMVLSAVEHARPQLNAILRAAVKLMGSD